MKEISDPTIFDHHHLPCTRVDGDSSYYYISSRIFARSYPFLSASMDREPLFAGGIYEVHILPKMQFRRIKANFLSVEYIQEGSLSVRQDGRCAVLEPGEIFLMQPGGESEFMTGPDGFCLKTSITLHGPLLPILLKLFELHQTDYILKFDKLRLQNLLKQFKELANRSSGEDSRRNGALCYQLLQFLRSPVAEPEVPERLCKLRSYLEEHVDESISLERMAEIYGCSKVYLTRLFRKVLGTTPHRMVTELRMRHAARLLLESTELSVKEVAFLTGYSNQLNFSTAFRKEYGLSPRDYRVHGALGHLE